MKLRHHPFAVEAFFETSLVLTYALPKAALQPLIPPCLQLDVFEDDWAFIAVAVVQTRDLRPKGWPSSLGHNFILTGYRIFVRYTDVRGRRLRGLYILRSETNKRTMSWLGNLFTHYNYATTDISLQQDDTRITVHAAKSDLHIEVAKGSTEIALPPDSPFPDWQVARRYAGPLPFTFHYEAATSEVLIIEGIRNNWTPQPVAVLAARVGFLQQPVFREAILANAFLTAQIPYTWAKGRTELWTKA